SAAFGWPSAGKSGTSQNYRDAWFIGYTANLVTGIWFGNDDSTPMRNVTGGTVPARAWKSFMSAAHEGLVPRGLIGGLWSPPADLPAQWPEHPESPVATRHDSKPAASRNGPVPPAEIGGSPRPRA